MLSEGTIDGRRFYHNTKRTISFVQMHRTKFTRFCVKLLREKKLPAPTQDTFMFYVANRFDPKSVGIVNIKRDYGFTQGNGKLEIDTFIESLKAVDKMNEGKTPLDIVKCENICDKEDFNDPYEETTGNNDHAVGVTPPQHDIDDIVIEIREVVQ